MPDETLPIEPWLQNINAVYSAHQLANPLRDLVGEGIVGDGSYKVSQRSAGANMSVDIAAGNAWVLGDDNPSLQPIYRQHNAGTVNVAVAAADGSNPRIDRVVLRIYDDLFDSSGNNEARLEVITGTPAGSPSAPAEPDTALTLALVNVGTGVSVIEDADIDDRRSPFALGISMPKASVRLASAQSLASSSGAGTVTLSVVDYDTGGLTDGVGFTLTRPGLWLATGRAQWDANTTGQRTVRVERTGSTELGGTQTFSANGVAQLLNQTVSQIFRWDGSDPNNQVRLQAGQSSGGNLTLRTQGTALRIHYLGAL